KADAKIRRNLTPCQAAGERNANRITLEFFAVCRCHILSPLKRASLSEDRNETGTGPRRHRLETDRALLLIRPQPLRPTRHAITIESTIDGGHYPALSPRGRAVTPNGHYQMK